MAKQKRLKHSVGWAFVDKSDNKILNWAMPVKDFNLFVKITDASKGMMDRTQTRNRFKLIKVKISPLKK